MADFNPITYDTDTVGDIGNSDAIREKYARLLPVAVTAATSYKHAEPYWDGERADENHSGYEHCQIFTCGQVGWLTQVGVYFSRLAASGGCIIKVCEVDALGHPDTTRVLSTTTVARETLLVAGAPSLGLPVLVETTVTITPTAVVASRRYALVIVALGDHYIAISEDEEDMRILNGPFFYAIDGVWQPQIGCIKTKLYFAQWNDSRYVIELQPLQLAGGIRGIDLIGQIAELGSSQVIIEGQINGLWCPIHTANTIDLSSLPSILPIRAVFIGMAHAHACMVLEQIKVRVFRAKTAFKFVSQTRTLGGNATIVKVVLLLAGFVSANHTVTVTVKAGSGPTTETADAVTDVLKPDGLLERTITFNIASAGSYFYEITGATNSLHSLFTVVEAIDYALAS